MNINDRSSAYYKYKVSVDMIYDNHPHKMQKRSQCLFLKKKFHQLLTSISLFWFNSYFYSS